MARLTDQELLLELEPRVESMLERHIKMARPWYPHDYVPYSQGKSFNPDYFDDAEPWTPDHPRLEGVAQTAFQLNLLTEDNLPSYHREIYDMFSYGDGAWLTWITRWTAEEDRPTLVLRYSLAVIWALSSILIV